MGNGKPQKHKTITAEAVLCLPLEGKVPEGRMRWNIMRRRENTSSVSLALDSFPSRGSRSGRKRKAGNSIRNTVLLWRRWRDSQAFAPCGRRRKSKYPTVCALSDAHAPACARHIRISPYLIKKQPPAGGRGIVFLWLKIAILTKRG